MNRLGRWLFAAGLIWSLITTPSAFAFECQLQNNRLVVAAKPAGSAVSSVRECRLQGVRALRMTAELRSSLVRARAYVDTSFHDVAGNRLWTVRKGPWLGRFDGLKFDESIAVPDGAASVRLSATVESASLDAAGNWEVQDLTVSDGVVLISDIVGGPVMDASRFPQFSFVTAPLGVAGEIVFQLRDRVGALLDERRVEHDGLRTEFALESLPVGYYEATARFISAAGAEGVWRGTFAILPEGPPPNESRFGMDAALSWYGGNHEMLIRSIQLMRLAGVGTVRDRMSWSRVQPSPGVSNWGRHEVVADLVANAGMESVQVFHDSPRWVRPGGVDLTDRQPPMNDDAVYEFGRAYARGLGRVVRNVEYWNEQNSNFFVGYPFQYASGLKAFFAGIKSVDPEIRVLIGGAAGQPGRFFEESYRNGVAKFIDARNQHYYGKSAQVDVFRSQHVSSIERDGGVSTLPGWLTEMGYALSRDEKGRWSTAESEQADYLVKTYVGGFSSGYERVFFFFWRELIEADQHTWGVLHEDFSPRPAYLALALLTRHLAGADLVATERRGNGRMSYFRKQDGRIVAVGWGGVGQLKVLGSALNVTDIYGKTVDANSLSSTHEAPVFVSGIEAIPNSAQDVVFPDAKLRKPPALRMEAGLTINNVPLAAPTSNRVAIDVDDGAVLEIRARTFHQGGRLGVECLPGDRINVLSSTALTVDVPNPGEKLLSCRFRSALGAGGESHISIRVTQGDDTDVAWFALAPDSNIAGTRLQARLLKPVDGCPSPVARHSSNLDIAIKPGAGASCPSFQVTSFIRRKGESWVFPLVQVQPGELLGGLGLRIESAHVAGVVAPPRPLMAQLVERSGGIWLVELKPGADAKQLTGLFSLARSASWAKDNNGRLDLADVSAIMIGWGGYGGEAGQRHGYAIERLELLH